MGWDEINIGSAPYSEDCVQVGSPEYYSKYKAEGMAFINQLKRVLGEPPAGAYFKLKGFPHDFGTYHEVVCRFDEDDEIARNYAFNAEGNTPDYWDDQARAELAAAGYFGPKKEGANVE
jgi:hypothetical protein